MGMEKLTSILGFGLICGLLSLLSITTQAFAGPKESIEQDSFFEMSIEDLMEIEITSVSKKEVSAFKAPAAIYVITQEDIRRSGATSIPDLLRMVPGMQVSQINSHLWAISIRGFAEQFANKLLVLIDGRNVYSSYFAGVLWAARDVTLEDVERIEVIRGPGGTIWGANAVNGVINIITKNAEDTQGTLIIGGGGTEEHGFGAIRYGDRINDNTYYRVYSSTIIEMIGTRSPVGKEKMSGIIFGEVSELTQTARKETSLPFREIYTIPQSVKYSRGLL